LTAGKNTLKGKPSAYVKDLRYPNDDGCADRAIKANREVTINEKELMDILTTANATFGAFRVRLTDGSTSIFFMYVAKGSEFSQLDHFEDLRHAKSSNNMNYTTNGSKQIDWHKVIQFVDTGPESNSLILLFRWDKLEPEYFKKFVNYF